MPANAAPTVAEIVARFLLARGVERIYGLQGGHIQPIWDQLGQLGVRIVDVRDEGAAVHMAHAHAALTGQVGVGDTVTPQALGELGGLREPAD